MLKLQFSLIHYLYDTCHLLFTSAFVVMQLSPVTNNMLQVFKMLKYINLYISKYDLS